MAKRKIRLRHMSRSLSRSRHIRRTSRSRSPSNVPPPSAAIRRPTRILRPSSSPQGKKDDVQKTTDAKKDTPKDVGTDVKRTEEISFHKMLSTFHIRFDTVKIIEILHLIKIIAFKF